MPIVKVKNKRSTNKVKISPIAKIGIIYSAVTLIYYFSLSLICMCFGFNITSATELNTVTLIIFFCIFTLSQAFKLIILFGKLRFARLLVIFSFFYSAVCNAYVGLNLSFLLLILSLFAAIVKCIVDMVRKNYTFAPFISFLTLFIIVGFLWGVIFIVDFETAYERTETIESPDGSYYLKYTVSYNVRNEQIQDSYRNPVYLVENRVIKVGLLSLESEQRYYVCRSDPHLSLPEIKWLDSDTFTVNGKEYEVAELIK